MKVAAATLLSLSLSLLATEPAVAQEDATRPRFTHRLQLPIRGDDFRLPRAVVADLATGEIMICDTFNHRILIFDDRGLFRHEITGGSIFRSPVDLAIDPEGLIYLLAQHNGRRTVLRLDFDGMLLNEVELSGFPDGVAEPSLVSLALSAAGDRLFLLDNANLSVWIADTAGAVLGSADLTPFVSDDLELELNLEHVDVSADSILVPIPYLGRVLIFETDGTTRLSVGRSGTASCQMAYPVAAAMRADGRIVVLDKQRALYMLWDPEENRCLSEHSGFGNAPGALYQPGDLALDLAGSIYVSQGFENRVQVFRAERADLWTAMGPAESAKND